MKPYEKCEECGRSYNGCPYDGYPIDYDWCNYFTAQRVVEE